MTSKRRLALALGVVLVAVVLLVVTRRGSDTAAVGPGGGSPTTVTLAPAVRPSAGAAAATTTAGTGTGSGSDSGSGTTHATTPRSTTSPKSTGAGGSATTRATTAGAPAGMATVAMNALPPEARTTLRLIADDGPFPYRQDGVVFGNREGHLPKKSSGYYHEYTVVTPGSPDRGARRIITGANGDHFYTSDHYASFRLVVDG